MEQDIADLLSDAFSDTLLPSYQEEDLNFDGLNFDEGDEERNKTAGNKLSVLTEVEESEEALSSICEEDLFPKGESWAESRISQSLDVDAMEESSDEGDSRKEREEDDIQEGTIEEVDSKEDKYEDTITESRNKEDSSEEKDEDDVLEMQKIGNEEMGSAEYRVGTVVQKDMQKSRDFRDEMVDVVAEESSSDELDSREVKYESVVMGISTEYPSEVTKQQKEYFQDREEDGGGMDHSPEYSSDVIRKQMEYSQEQEEDMENAQSGKGSYVTDEEEENDGSRRKHEELYHSLCSVLADKQEDGEKTHAIECKEEEIYVSEQESLSATGIGSTGFSKGWSPLENEDARNSVFQGLLEPQFEDDMKEFSEDDLGVIGEDYAEYPSECFQQTDKAEKAKKGEDMQIESIWMTAKLEMEGTAQLRGEIFEWELLDRHTEIHDECSESEETARDIPDEEQSAGLKNLRHGPQNMFSEKKHTEQQDAEGDCLRKEDQGMEGNGPVKDEMAQGVQEVMGLTYSSAWKKIDKGDLADSEPQKDTMVFGVTHGDFLNVQDESGMAGWAEDPLITENRNSQEIFEKVCLTQTENQARDVKAEEISLVTESEEEKLTDVSFQYETCNVTDVQQQKSQNYNEEEELNYEQDTDRTEAFYQYNNDHQDHHTRKRSGNSKKHTVTFCLEPNLQRDSESSDLENGDSSSSDSTEDHHTSQTRQFLDLEEDSDDYRRRQNCALLHQSSATQREPLNRELKIHRQNDTISWMAKSFLKICLTTVVGVLFFWWASDQLDWVGKSSVD